MQTLQYAGWLGISLLLHLAAASLVLGLSGRPGRPAHRDKAVIVTLASVPETAVSRASSTRPATGPVRPAAEVRGGLQDRSGSLAAEETTPGPRPSPVVPAVDPAVPAPAGKAPAATPVAGVPVRPGVAPAPTATLQAPPAQPQQAYPVEHLSRIRELAERGLVYPVVALRMRWHGTVSVAVVVAEDGAVHGARVVKTSGYPVLDRSALEAIEALPLLPKPPTRIEIVIPVRFAIPR